MFPKYQEIQTPLLVELLRRGGNAQPSDLNEFNQTVYEALAEYFGLSAEDQAVKVYEKTGVSRSKWENMVRWARNDLRKLGLLDASQRGMWALTERGRSLIYSHYIECAGKGIFSSVLQISPDQLRQQYEEAQEIGRLGETYVVELEKKYLEKEGRQDLAKMVVHVANFNVAAGYDTGIPGEQAG